MKISIASDHAGFEQKQELRDYLTGKGHEVVDRGPDSDDRVDYPDFAALVAHDVADGNADYGVLVCGTGIGMAVAANKIHGIRAVNCITTQFAELAREHNNANMLAFGARVVGPELAKMMVDEWLDATYCHRHDKRVAMIGEIEQTGGIQEQV